MLDIKKKLVLLVVLLIAAAAISYISVTPHPFAFLPQKPSTLGEDIRSGKAAPPPFSTSTQQKLAASNGFQYLVSYTDLGFEPVNLTVHDGETVRFTNNSSQALWVAASAAPGETIYPSAQNGCGSSQFDSCTSIAPQDFWEFTFTKTGTWKFTNNLMKNDAGIVQVVVK